MSVQFGLGISASSANGSDPVGDALKAEAVGFDFVSANDHFHATGPRHELWTLMAWIAASTSRIKVASRVLGVPFRNPAVVAKMAETFDRLSDGRLILGLGAGHRTTSSALWAFPRGRCVSASMASRKRSSSRAACGPIGHSPSRVVPTTRRGPICNRSPRTEFPSGWERMVRAAWRWWDAWRMAGSHPSSSCRRIGPAR